MFVFHVLQDGTDYYHVTEYSSKLWGTKQYGAQRGARFYDPYINSLIF